MYGHHALIKALSTHMIHVYSPKKMFYTHIEQCPTNKIYIKYYMKQKQKTSECNEFKPFVRMHEFINHTPFGTAQWGDWFHQWTGSSEVASSDFANTLIYQALSVSV